MKNMFTKEFGERGKEKGKSFFLPVKMKNNAIVSIAHSNGGIYCKVKDTTLEETVSETSEGKNTPISIDVQVSPYVSGKERDDEYLLELANIYAEQLAGEDGEFAEPFWRFARIHTLNFAIAYLMETKGAVNKQILTEYFQHFAEDLLPDVNMTDTEYYKTATKHISFNADSLCKKSFDTAFSQTVKTTALVFRDILVRLQNVCE